MEAHKDFDTILASQEFGNWLTEHPMGDDYVHYLTKDPNAVKKAISIVKEYKRVAGIVEPEPETTDVEDPSPTKKEELAKRARPKSRNRSDPAVPEKKGAIYSISAMTKLSATKPHEYAKHDAAYTKAVLEGRTKP